MPEKIITLENVSLVDFLGIENQNVKALSDAFPDSRIVSRGNEIRIKGTGSQILKINNVLDSLLAHYHKYGRVTSESVRSFAHGGEQEDHENEKAEVLIYGTGGFRIIPKTAHQKELVKTVEENDLTFVIGPAGTGKTYISIALAVKALKSKKVKKIIITRPAVEAGENLGFLPGDLKEKTAPYLQPVYDALRDMISSEKLRYYSENEIIEIAPLAYMRGRTLNNAYILLDEAQNTTPMQIKMFLTRIGTESKVIVTGDTSQIDLPKNQPSGFVEAIRILRNVKGIGFAKLDDRDVVRHKLIKSIIKAYEQDETQNHSGQ